MPKPPIPEHPDRTVCRNLGCKKLGAGICTGCKDANPRTRYCSRQCQRQDWKYHKKYCGKKTYTFRIELLRSRKPAIKRTVHVPSWYTFQYLHFVVQYAFGPWQQSHLHEFMFTKETLNRNGMFSYEPDGTVLRIVAEGEDDSDYYQYQRGRRMYEKDIKLEDIYDVRGKYRHLVLNRDGGLISLKYLYDFGDNWEHLITFKSEKMAVADRPLFSKAIGYPPAEDAGGITGWEEVKEAFAAERPTAEQRERRKWAIERMGLKDRIDPLAVGEKYYSPFNEVNIIVMNYEGRWENHLEMYREGLGETIERPYYSDDDDLFDSDEDSEI